MLDKTKWRWSAWGHVVCGAHELSEAREVPTKSSFPMLLNSFQYCLKGAPFKITMKAVISSKLHKKVDLHLLRKLFSPFVEESYLHLGKVLPIIANSSRVLPQEKPMPSFSESESKISHKLSKLPFTTHCCPSCPSCPSWISFESLAYLAYFA